MLTKTRSGSRSSNIDISKDREASGSFAYTHARRKRARVFSRPCHSTEPRAMLPEISLIARLARPLLSDFSGATRDSKNRQHPVYHAS